MPRRENLLLRGSTLVVALVVASGVAAGTGLLSAGAKPVSASEHNHLSHDHGTLGGFQQYTDPGDIWPPRIEGISNDQAESTERRETVRAQVGTALRGEPQGAPQERLADVLGERFERIVSGPDVDAKGNSAPGRVRTTYFSYSNNETVELVEKGGRIVHLSRTPASEDQPPRTEAEQKRAVALARAELTSQGFARAQDLEGYVILGLPHADNEMPDVSTPYFASRILYVSFHVDAVSDPEFVAWVDLSNERVLRAEEE